MAADTGELPPNCVSNCWRLGSAPEFCASCSGAAICTGVLVCVLVVVALLGLSQAYARCGDRMPRTTRIINIVKDASANGGLPPKLKVAVGFYQV